MEIYRQYGWFVVFEHEDGEIIMKCSAPLDVELAEIIANGILVKLNRNQKVIMVDPGKPSSWPMFRMKLVDKSDGS